MAALKLTAMIIPDEVLESLSGGLSLLVACCGPDGRALCTRGVGLRVWPDRQRATLFLARATASPLSDQLLVRPSVAFVLSRPNDYRTIQLKGRALAVRDAPDADRALVVEFVRAFADVVDGLGVPRHIGLRVAHWPCLAVDVEVTDIFAQTPGPGAGAPLLRGGS
ncbi:MAG TPA: hypothetical protein VGC79_35655 [Polyangiaceae bacterium]